MHVENDKIFAVKWKKEWKNVSSDGARVGSNLFLLFSNLRRIYGASIDEKIIMFTRGTNPTTEILEKKLLVWNVEKNVKFCLRNGRYFGNAVYVAPTR